MEYYVEPEKKIPVTDRVDVLVAGGGPAGIGAAVAAARQGCKTVTYQNRCQKENLSGINRVEPGNTGKPRNIKGFRDILILKKALCDINNEKKAKTLCYNKVKKENPTLKYRKG